MRVVAAGLDHSRAADSVSALVTAIALVVTVPVWGTAVWIVRVVWIRVIEWKRGKERKPEVVDDNYTVEVVKSMVLIEVIKPVESGGVV